MFSVVSTGIKYYTTACSQCKRSSRNGVMWTELLLYRKQLLQRPLLVAVCKQSVATVSLLTMRLFTTVTAASRLSARRQRYTYKVAQKLRLTVDVLKTPAPFCIIFDTPQRRFVLKTPINSITPTLQHKVPGEIQQPGCSHMKIKQNGLLTYSSFRCLHWCHHRILDVTVTSLLVVMRFINLKSLSFETFLCAK